MTVKVSVLKQDCQKDGELARQQMYDPFVHTVRTNLINTIAERVDNPKGLTLYALPAMNLAQFRFVRAHMAAHVYYGHFLNVSETWETLSVHTTDEFEEMANAFACGYLIPQKDLDAFLIREQRIELRDIANYFVVPLRTVFKRLQYLDYVE